MVSSTSLFLFLMLCKKLTSMLVQMYAITPLAAGHGLFPLKKTWEDVLLTPTYHQDELTLGASNPNRIWCLGATTTICHLDLIVKGCQRLLRNLLQVPQEHFHQISHEMIK